MTVCFLRDASTLLAMVSTVRQKNFERRLQTEREMIKYCFPFDRINYSRYLMHQFVSLRALQIEQSIAVKDTKKPLKQYQ